MDYKHRLIELAMRYGALEFGEFTLKSGRKAPYFFNTGRFIDGNSMLTLGQCYAALIHELGLHVDGLFGPAYKGIPLVTTTAIALAEQYDCNVSYSFNRKEAKDHGEGGLIVGAPLQGNLILVDDVITAGTAVNEAMAIIERSAANVVAMVVALDRQERAPNQQQSALASVAARYNIPIHSLLNFQDLLRYLQASKLSPSLIESMQAYQQTYACADNE